MNTGRSAKWIAAFSLALAWWAAFATVLPAQTAHPPRQESTGSSLVTLRSSQLLNAGWRFKRQASPGEAVEPEFVGAEKPDYDDASWSSVHLPHTWDATPDNPFTTTGHFHGLGWYRRKFEIPAAWQGRRVGLRFNGVFQIADVWVNGRHAGRHVGGYTSFEFDVTDALRWGATNLVAVRVDDVLSTFIAPTNETNVANYGGICRSVFLTTTGPVHIPSDGVRITTERSDRGVLVHVRTAVENHSEPARRLRVETLVTDDRNQPVASLPSKEITLAAKDRTEVEQTSEPLANAHLGSPDSPYLYHLVSTVYDGDRALDRIDTHFGVRFMGYDPARGFTLNGRFINLHGVNRRQDYGFLGDAVPEAVGIRDIQLIKSMGANFLRTSHYPQDPAILDACDRLGILVWEEIPNIKIHMYPPASDGTQPVYTERFPWPLLEDLKQQLREMIDRDFNHPSIIIWGLGDDLSGYHYAEDFVDLSNTTHALDPTRWTAGRVPPVTDISDATIVHDLVHQHALHPERRYIWNEWGSFASERGLEGKPNYRSLPADPLSDVALPDSEAALLMEGYLMQWNAMPWMGTTKWCMFDTGEVNATYTRNIWHLPFPDGRVTFRWPFSDYLGVADPWRLPKEGFYFLQSQWTDQPMVHIVGHGMCAGKAGGRRVRVYSNGDTVELFLNGKSLGVKRPATSERVWNDFHEAVARYKVADQFNQRPLPGSSLRHPPFIWDDVPCENGTLTAVGRQGDVSVRHTLRTPGSPVRIELKAEKPSLAADDADVSFIEADVVDAQSVVIPEARPWIHFSVEGPGRLLGGAVDIDAISGVAAINVQSTGQPGEIIVRASSPGIESGVTKIEAGR